MMPACFFVSFYYYGLCNKDDKIQPTASNQGDKDEQLNVVLLEVVDLPTMTPILLHDTEAFKAMESNLDHTVPAKNRSGMSVIESSKTREFLDATFDNRLNEENLTGESYPSISQNIKFDKSI